MDTDEHGFPPLCEPLLIATVPRDRLGVALAMGWTNVFADLSLDVPAGRALVGRPAAADQTHDEIAAAFDALHRRVEAARLTGS